MPLDPVKIKERSLETGVSDGIPPEVLEEAKEHILKTVLREQSLDLREALGVIESLAYYLEITSSDEAVCGHLQSIRDMVSRVNSIVDPSSGARSVAVELWSRPASERRTNQEIELIKKALEVVGSASLAQWLQTPIPALRGQTPYSQMQFEEGRKEVEKVLVRIDHGVY